jgi:hypothetical protein
MRFLKRNLPIFITGAIVLLIFFVVIAISQSGESEVPDMVTIDQPSLIAPHTHLLGFPEAPFSLVMFSDYVKADEKPYYEAAIRLYEENRQHLNLAIRPYESGKEKEPAAKAPQVAGEQNRFWEYLGELFSLGGGYTPDEEDLAAIAIKVDIDEERFLQGLQDKRYETTMEADFQDARGFGVSEELTIFLNGTRLEVNSAEELLELVQEQIDRVKQREQEQEKAQADAEESQQQKKELTPQQVYRAQELYEIVFDGEEWQTEPEEPIKGQRVRWINATDEEIILQPLDKHYEGLKESVTIEPGDSFEFIFPTGGIFRFQEKYSWAWHILRVEW